MVCNSSKMNEKGFPFSHSTVCHFLVNHIGEGRLRNPILQVTNFLNGSYLILPYGIWGLIPFLCQKNKNIEKCSKLSSLYNIEATIRFSFRKSKYKLCKELTNHTKALSFQQLFYFAKAKIFRTSLDTKLC